ncbi:MAG: hypothetical protein ABFE01_28500 [Phycisphaerales bacterium]
MKTIAIRGVLLGALALSVMGCQTSGLRVQMSREQAGESSIELSGGIAATDSGEVYVTTPAAVMRYKPKGNQFEDLLLDPCQDVRDVAVTSDGVVLVLRQHELSTPVAGYLVSLYSLPEDGIAVSCGREFAYVLTARGQGARLIRIGLSGANKGLQQTLLVTEDRPRALCAVQGGCLVASGGNIVKVADPAPAAKDAESQVATVLLAAVQEPVTSVAADQGKLIVYFATANTTYAWIQGKIVPIFPAGSRLAWAKDTLTICQPSRPGSQMVQVPAVSKHAEGLVKQLEKGTSKGRP